MAKGVGSAQLANWHTKSPTGVIFVYYKNMFNPNTTFNPAFPYAVVCDSAPHENSVFKTLDECWGLCLDLSEEYGYSEIWYGKCLMGSYKNGQ